jgi:phosphoglucosamine mutase
MVPRFGTDGIRGVAGTDLTPELALALGRAAARLVPGSPFLLGRDTRQSGTMLQAALAAGIAAEGVDALDVGVIPTPGLAWLAVDRGVPAAMVSASHNPFGDNGIKLLGASGTKLPAALEISIQDELDRLCSPAAIHVPAGLPGVDETGAPSGRGPGGAGLGVLSTDAEALERYAEHLVQAVAGGARPGFEVVVDCANGAASTVAPAVLERLGVPHRVLSASPDGRNINAGCGSTHLQPLQEAVVKSGAALGVALDGDADRVLAVDHCGEVVDGDQLLAVFALDLAERGLLTGGSIVVTVMSNLGLRQALAARGIGVVETPLGDRHVSDALEANNLQLGGEQSGHLVFRQHGMTGDGILTSLLLMELVARSGRTLAQLAADAMTRLPQVLRNVPVRDPARLALARGVWEEVSLAESELGDKGRVLLRASGTEAVVRVMVEAPTHERALEVADRLVSAVVSELEATGGAGRP